MAGGTPANPATIAKNMRGNPVGSLCAQAALRMGRTECIAGRFARGCSLSGIGMGFDLERFSSPRLGVVTDKVMAGGTPANPATIAENMRGNLDGRLGRRYMPR